MVAAAARRAAMLRQPSPQRAPAPGAIGERRCIHDLLAVFEDTTLLNVVAGRIKDLGDRVEPGERVRGDRAFQRRLAETSEDVFRSARSDAVRRLQLWHGIRESFGLEAAIPLATRTANLRAAVVAQRAAVELGSSTAQGQEQRSWTDLRGRVWSGAAAFFSSPEPADFGGVVVAQAARLLAEAAREGRLDNATKDALLERVRRQLGNAPPELRDRSVEEALKVGDGSWGMLRLNSGTVPSKRP